MSDPLPTSFLKTEDGFTIKRVCNAQRVHIGESDVVGSDRPRSVRTGGHSDDGPSYGGSSTSANICTRGINQRTHNYCTYLLTIAKPGSLRDFLRKI
jgi:hypothetical protein